jgi:hypothetical protein
MSVTFVVWERLPLVAEIVRVEVPAGVDTPAVTVSTVDPEFVTEAGVNTAVAPAGNVLELTEKLTVPVKPFKAATDIEYPPLVYPCATV